MALSIDEQQLKSVMTEIIVEMLEEKNKLLYEVITDAIEDVALAHAITEGRKDDFISEDTILTMLEN